MYKVKLERGPASRYAATNEVIREFSDGQGRGGLLALRVMSEDADVTGIVVDVYGCTGVTVNVSRPDDVPAIDWVPNGLRVGLLTDDELMRVIAACNGEVEKRQTARLVEVLRKAVAVELAEENTGKGEPVLVRFHVSDSDGGLFFDADTPMVTWADGTSAVWELTDAGAAEVGDVVGELTAIYADRTIDSSLTVTLATGAVVFDPAHRPIGDPFQDR
jgi:hypothetical protein